MEFKFPFPTLKQLAVLRVCQHLADNRLGFFQEVDNISNWGVNGFLKQRDDLIRKHRYVIDGLPIAPPVKAYVWDVWFGICDQVCRFLHESFPETVTFKCHGIKFYFDSHGRLDDKRIWQSFFEEKLSGAKIFKALSGAEAFLALSGAKTYMRDLFGFAWGHHLVPQIDMTFKQIIASLDESQKVLGPQHNIIEDNHVMDYHLPNMSQAFEGEVSQIMFPLYFVEKHTNGFRVSIEINTSHLNFEAFKVCYSLLKSSQKVEFIKDVLLRSVVYRWRAGHVLDILTYLHENEKQGWMPYSKSQISDRPSNFMYYVSVLSFWPFFQFAAPMLKILSNFVKEWMYSVSFKTVADDLPADDPVYGFLLSNMSLAYWNSMPKNMKKKFAIAYLGPKRAKGKYLFPEAMDILKEKSPITYDAIEDDMKSLIDENN